MELKTLKIFAVVASTGSISRAAEDLHYVQSNVTARIQKLEEQLDTQLFIRSRQGMSLTPAGEILLEYAKRTLLLIDEARTAVASTHGLSCGLRLGSLETTLAMRLADALYQFRRQYPKVEMQITTGNTDQLVNAVLNHQLDGAFVAGLVSHPFLNQQHIFTEEVVLISSTEMKDIEAWTTRTLIVFRQGCAYRALAEQWLRQTGITPVRLMELGTLDGMLACVRAGLGICVLPRSAVEKHRLFKKISMQPIDMDNAHMSVGLIRHRDSLANASLDAFLQLVNSSN